MEIFGYHTKNFKIKGQLTSGCANYAVQESTI